MLQGKSRHRWAVVCALLGMLAPSTRSVSAEEFQSPPKEVKVTAPEKTVRLEGGLGGDYFVDETLLKSYDALRARLSAIQHEIAAGKPSSKSALDELREIEEQAKRLREMIDATKTFVAAFKAFKKTDEVVFPLAESRRIIVRGDNVKIRGWEGPGIKCLVEKIVLAETKPADAEFDAIRILHDVSVAEELVGRTPEQRAADEQEFRNSAAGQELTAEQLRAREKFLTELFGGFALFRDFQGELVNNLSVVGLNYDEGNRQLTYRINSPGGGGSYASEWSRHAAVTIYVPPCKHVMVAGCLVKLDIRDIHADLLLTTQHSRDRDYNGSFEVHSVTGNVVIDQAPVRVLNDVQGNVTCVVTEEFANTGTRHEGGFRTAYTPETHTTSLTNIRGNLEARFLRTNLRLSGLSAGIDARNDFGNSHLTMSADSKIDKPMRILSQSGDITVVGPRAVLEAMPIFAHTECGTLRTDLSSDVLKDVDFSMGSPRQSWSGFVTPGKERFSMDMFERPSRALRNEPRDPGLDLISRSGRVFILTREPVE